MTGPTPEHLDVLVVGAGLSGIAACHHIRRRCPWASYAVLEARGAIGGTWDLFRYPGVRSDSDMYTLGYSFRPWEGGKVIGGGESILQYLRDTAAEEGIDEHVRFHHRVVRADWSTEDACWRVTAERTDTGETVRLTCGFLFCCSGYYRYDRGHLPDFEGLHRFGGTVVHPQEWPEDLDHARSRVVVIGSGATAVTLVPALARDAEHVTMLQRTPSYVVALPTRNPLVSLLRRFLPDRLGSTLVRWFHALTTQAFFQLSKRRPSLVKRLLRAGARARLPEGYDVDTHFGPPYDPWDQRLCVAPDGDLFEAIADGRAEVVTDHVETFTEHGLRLRSGRELEADVVVTATGLELLFIGGIEVSVEGEVLALPDRLTYKGMMLEGVPNLALAIGYTNASWTLKCELTCDRVARLLEHMRETGMRQCTPVGDAAGATPGPILGLSSGYVQRSAHRFPKQGTRDPWRLHQSYLRDYRSLKLSPVSDDAMVFSNPRPAVATAPTSPSEPVSTAP